MACFSSFFSSKASIKSPTAPIELKGELVGGGAMRGLPVIEAYLNAFGVEVIFNNDLGNLVIDVINETGDSVFKKTVNAKAGGTLTIDTIGWESGEYILVIMDGQGGYLEGSFPID